MDSLSPGAERVKQGRFLRAAGLVAALTLISRILGLVREQVFAALLGAGMAADAYTIAFRIPNLLRDLFAEGALSAALVPTYTRTLAEQGREAAHRLGSRLLTLLSVILGLIVLAGIVFAAPILRLIAGGFGSIPGKLELTVGLTRVMMPFLPLVSFAAVAMGMLNAEGRFGLPALSPATFNLVAIGVGLGLWGLGWPPEQVAFGWALGTLLGGAAQFAIQLPALWRQGWHFRGEWAPGAPEIRQIGRLMMPATVGLGAVQINILLNSYFATWIPGAAAWLSYAFRVLYLPIGLFGVAVGTIATTGFARAATARDTAGMRSTLQQSVSTLMLLTLPSTVGVVVLATPIVRLLYERGRFTPIDTQAVATALLLYAVGLPSYALVKVFAPAFYALGAPRLPLVASSLAVATNLAINVAFHRQFGFGAVALGTALGSIANATLLGLVLSRRLGGVTDGRSLRLALARMSVASAVMGAVSWWTLGVLEEWVGTKGLGAALVTGLGPVAVGGCLYALLCRALGVEEARVIGASLRRRLFPA